MANAKIYADERMKLMKLNTLFRVRPNIATKINYQVLQADPKLDYYYNDTFKSRAIKVLFTVSESLCNTVNCFPYKSNGSPCANTDKAEFYRLGDTEEFDVSCHPSCFNIRNEDKKTADDSNTMKNQNITTRFIKGQCRFTNMIFKRNMELPIYRSDAMYTENVNDFVVGFDRIDNSDGTYVYRTNRPYCEAFEDDYDPDTKNCVPSFIDKYFLYPVFGDAIIRYVKKSSDKLTNAVTNRKKNPYPDPPEITDEYMLDNWLNDINRTFILPSYDMNVPPTVVSLTNSEIETLNAERSTFFYMKQETPNYVKKTKLEDDKSDNLFDFLKNQFSDIFNKNKDLGLIPSVIIQLGTDKLIREIEALLKNISVDLIKSLVKSLLSMSSKVTIFSEVLATSFNVMMSKLFEEMLPAELLITLTSTLAELVSTLGDVLIISQVFSIILTFWDPWHLNEKYSNDSMDKMCDSSEKALEKYLRVNGLVVNADYILKISLNKEDVSPLLANYLVYVYEYLSSLTVNSEGSVIEQGYIINSVIKPTEYDYNLYATQLHIYNPQQLYDYEREHKTRLDAFNRTGYVCILFIIFGMVMTYLEQIILSILFYLVGCIFLYLNYMNIFYNVNEIISINNITL